MYSALLTPNVIHLQVDGRSFTVPRSSAQANSLFEELHKPAPDEQLLVKLASYREALKSYSGSDCTIQPDGQVWRNGQALPKALADRVHACFQDGVPYQYLLNFFDRLEKNPSRRAIQELYTFLEHHNMPITPEGKFLGYKGVRKDYMDCYTGSFSNKPGCRLQMKRQQVCDDADVGCSYGFHVGSLEYARGFVPSDGHLMIVEVDPADVVSVPKDCGFQKLRTCEYRVVGEYSGKLNESAVGNSDAPYDTAFAGNKMDDNLPDVHITVTHRAEKPKAKSAAFLAGEKRARKLYAEGMLVDPDKFFANPRRKRHIRETYGSLDDYIKGYKSVCD